MRLTRTLEPKYDAAMQTLLRLFSFAALGFAALSTQAKTVEYPAGNPLFKLELPDGWTTSTDGKGNLDVKADDKSDFEFSIIPAPAGQDIKSFLPELAKGMGKQMKDLQVGEIAEMTTKPGMKVMILNAKGKIDSSDMVATLAAFAPEKEKYFIILSVAEKSVDEAHSNAMVAILDSIQLSK